jgi:hypothetical protein
MELTVRVSQRPPPARITSNTRRVGMLFMVIVLLVG